MKYLYAALAMFVLPSALYAEGAAHWQVLPDKSSIEWTATYGGKAIKGEFPDFTSEVAFDIAHLDASHVNVKVQIAKVKSADKDAESSLPTDEWFSANQYPVAVFEADKFTHIKDDNYEATGTLSIRGKSVPFTLPFSIKFYDDNSSSPSTHYARVTSDVTLKRLDFGVGQGDWAKTDAVADPVQVTIHIEAKQIP